MMEEIWKNDGERKRRNLCFIEHPPGLSCRGYDWILCPVLEVAKMSSIFDSILMRNPVKSHLCTKKSYRLCSTLYSIALIETFKLGLAKAAADGYTQDSAEEEAAKVKPLRS